MVFGTTLKAPRALRVRSMVWVLLCLAAPLTTTGLLAADAAPISPLVALANTTQSFVVNGAFENGDRLAYEATLTGGQSLPSWMKFDSGTGTFTFRAPAADVGKVFQVTVMATDDSFTTFYVLVDDSSYSCSVDANVDRRGQVIDCATGSVQLHGETSTKGYSWTGPNGFTSTSASPYVSSPGLYILTTTASGGDCPRRSIVEVTKGCGNDSGKNLIPVGRIQADRTSGEAPLDVQFDASGSNDADGKVVRYDWYWEGGTASGATPLVTFPEGVHEVILVVTDEVGARSTDRVTITAGPAPAGAPETADAGSYWLEAECAEVGSRWTTESSSSAAAGKYVVVRSGNSMNSAPSDVSDNRIRFTLDAQEGTYDLFARIEARTNLDDSYWVRINGGSWYKWSSGIEQGGGFNWNEFPRSLSLREGTNTIDVAYREDGTRLDKLFLTNEGQRPSGTGANASNCGGSGGTSPGDEEVTSTYWLEAECGRVGSGWESVVSNSASGGMSLTYKKNSSISAPNTGNSGELITYEVDVARAATYHLFLRMEAATLSTNSFWVRIDGGSWIKFWKNARGGDLLTQGLQWRKVAHDGKDVSFNLSAGKHTITIANREKHTLLDKLVLTTSTNQLTGFGGKANNCGTSSQTMDMFDMTLADEPEDTDEELLDSELALSVYPNPATVGVTLELTSEYAGRVDVVLTDVTGRRVRQLQFDKAGPLLRTQVDVSSLSKGMYYFRVLEGDRQTIQAFAKQ